VPPDDDLIPLEGLLAWRLSMAGHLLRRHTEQAIGPVGVPRPELGVLIRLLEEDGLPEAEIGRRQRCGPTTAAALLDRLEAGGLVRRGAPGGGPSRAWLTAAGREAAERGHALVHEVEDASFGVLSPADRRRLAELLGRVVDGLSAPVPPDA
jgi:DNA-binding MarR family transcriptional regulator